jgi:peroxiredoxin
MIIAGDKIPSATFMVMTAEGPKPRTTDEVFAGKKVVLFGVPGAFTPTCHKNHLPGFLAKEAEIKAKGVHTIAVVSVNDAFVMGAWAKDTGSESKIEFLADGSATFSKAIDLTVDLTERGLGIRSRRYAMIVDNGIVKSVNVEEAAGVEVSGADHILKLL